MPLNVRTGNYYKITVEKESYDGTVNENFELFIHLHEKTGKTKFNATIVSQYTRSREIIDINDLKEAEEIRGYDFEMAIDRFLAVDKAKHHREMVAEG